MCLLMWKPADVVLTKRDVHDYYNHNPDGFGVMWLNDKGRVCWYKMVGSKKATWKAYQQYAAGRECALHFRWATAGAINVGMAHPFKVTPAVLMMHNGILACASTAARSDTAEFADIMARELEKHPERLHDDAYIRALDEIIGPGNRLLFLRDGAPEPIIVGRDKGLEHKGAWYSNTYAWSNDYYDPCGGWAWKDDKWGKVLPITRDAPMPNNDPDELTPRERSAIRECEDWIDRYRYADRAETVDYFVDWYGRTDAERVRLRMLLEDVCNAS